MHILDSRSTNSIIRSLISSTSKSGYRLLIKILFSISIDRILDSIIIKTEYTSINIVSRYLLLSNISILSGNSNLILLISINMSIRSSILLIVSFRHSNSSNNISIILISESRAKVSNIRGNMLLCY